MELCPPWFKCTLTGLAITASMGIVCGTAQAANYTMEAGDSASASASMSLPMNSVYGESSAYRQYAGKWVAHGMMSQCPYKHWNRHKREYDYPENCMSSTTASQIRQDTQKLMSAGQDPKCRVFDVGMGTDYGPGFEGRSTGISGEHYNSSNISVAVPAELASWYGVRPGVVKTLAVMSIDSDGTLRCIPRVPITDTGSFRQKYGRVVDASEGLARSLHINGVGAVVLSNCCPTKTRQDKARVEIAGLYHFGNTQIAQNYSRRGQMRSTRHATHHRPNSTPNANVYAEGTAPVYTAPTNSVD